MPNQRKCNYNQSKLDIWMMSMANVNMQTLNWIEAARVLICYSQCSLLNLNAYTNTFIQLTEQSERMMRLRSEPLCIVTGQAKCVCVSVCYLEVTGEEELNNNICYLSVALLSSTEARAHAKKRERETNTNNMYFWAYVDLMKQREKERWRHSKMSVTANEPTQYIHNTHANIQIYTIFPPFTLSFSHRMDVRTFVILFTCD